VRAQENHEEIGSILVGWNDFVVPILDAWTIALASLVAGRSKSERVYFMDGPYAADVVRSGSNSLSLRLLERGLESERFEVDLMTLAESVAREAEIILDACRATGSWTDDADSLEGDVSALRHAMARSAR